MVIGLTGGIGSGKTLASGIFESLGVNVVYADKVGRDVLDNNIDIINQVVTMFGKEVLSKKSKHNGLSHLNKAKLRTIIFNDSKAKLDLETLLHPLITQNIKHLLSTSNSPYSILEAAILIESKFDVLVDKVLVIDCDEFNQISRVLARDKESSEKEIKSIMATQLERKERLTHADFIIENNGTLKDLEEKVKTMHQQFLGIKPTK